MHRLTDFWKSISLGKNRPYESQVILLIALLGTVRLLIALIIDLTRVPINPVEVGTDAGLFLVLAMLLWVGSRNMQVKSIHPVFGFLLTLLLALNFLEFNGVYGYARFNYIIGFYALGLLYAGRWLIAHLCSHGLIMFLIAYLNTYRGDWISFLHLGIGGPPADFFFALLVSAALSFYFKQIIESEIRKDESLQSQLLKNVNMEKEINGKLRVQNDAFQLANEQLKLEVLKKTQTLQQQQDAIRQYVHMHTSVFHEPLEELTRQLSALPADYPLTQMASVSRHELQSVVENIHETLAAREQLHRTKVIKK